MEWQTHVLRVLVAAVCGAILGFQAEMQRRPGGMRPHILTALGAAMFCGTAVSIADNPSDATRAIQGIASGVGFIGAAMVIRAGDTVVGVGNASSLWIAAAVGCQASLGHRPLLAVGFSVFVALLNLGALALRRWRTPKESPVDDGGAPGESRAERNARDFHSAL
ncbi:MAG: MgtC/SapB family protein [Polyangiaceae bacterium]